MNRKTTLDLLVRLPRLVPNWPRNMGARLFYFSAPLVAVECYQLGIVAAIYLVAHLASWFAKPPLHQWMRTREAGFSGACGGCWSFIGG
jgi:hypothetical protein